MGGDSRRGGAVAAGLPGCPSARGHWPLSSVLHVALCHFADEARNQNFYVLSPHFTMLAKSLYFEKHCVGQVEDMAKQ